MVHGGLSKVLESTGLERYQRRLETKLKVSSVSQLLKMANLRQALIGLGMKEEEVEELRKVLESSAIHMKLERLGQQVRPPTKDCLSAPTSPCQGQPPLLLNGRPYTYPTSVQGVHYPGTATPAAEVPHSPRCPCDACCNRRNEEYLTWFRTDDVKTKNGHQPLTRLSEKGTADDVRKALEIIYTTCPNKFVVPDGRAVVVQGIHPAPSELTTGDPAASPEHSPTSSDSERTPPKPGFKIHLPWKTRTPTSQSSPFSTNHGKGHLAHRPSLLRQRSQEDSRSKVNGSTTAAFFSFSRIHEVIEKRKNKLSLRINVPKEDDEAYKDLNIKPMSANAERKMKETLDEIAKMRNNNSPKSPAPKLMKDSPTNPKGSTSFKFPQTLKSSSFPSSQEKTVSSLDNAESGNPNVLFTPGKSGCSSNYFTDMADSIQIRFENQPRKINLNRLSSASSSSSQRSFKAEPRSPRHSWKIKGRLSRRTTSECACMRPRATSFGGMSYPYLPMTRHSVELKSHRKNSCDESMVFGQLFSNPLLHSPRVKYHKQSSMNEESSTEFIIKFKSMMTFKSEYKVDLSPSALKGDDFKAANNNNELKNPLANSPPPALPPRVPIKQRSTPGLSIRDSISKKRQFPKRESAIIFHNPSPKGFEFETCSMTLNRASSRAHFSKSEKTRQDHPAVYGPPGSNYKPKVHISNAACKSYDQIPRQRSELASHPLDHRFSADASTFVGRLRCSSNFGSASGSGRDEDDSTISNSSSECQLDESTSYEDLMEQALDSSVKLNVDEEDVRSLHESRNTDPGISVLKECNWLIPQPKKRSAEGNDRPILSPVLVGHF